MPRASSTSPNIVVFGQIGRGKSAFVKSFVWRQLRSAANAGCSTPRASTAAWPGPAASCRCGWGRGSGSASTRWTWGARGAGGTGPADSRRPGPLAITSPAHQRRSELLGALLSSSLGRALQPEERAAADMALRAVEARMPVPTLAEVAQALLAPEPGHASAARHRHRGAAPGRPAGGARTTAPGGWRPGRDVRRGDLPRPGHGRRHGGPGPVPPVRVCRPWDC